MTQNLFIDLETYSSIPIKEAGAHRYVRSSDFEILLFAYSLDGAPVQIVDLISGETLPPWLMLALIDPHYIKHAFNAPFEHACLSKLLGMELPADQWRCTMFHGLYCGYPASLDAAGKAIGLDEDKQKLEVGKALIRYFCKPCKETKVNGGRTRNYPHHDPDKWRLFKEYCIQDVVTEMEIERRLSASPVPDALQKEWETDLRINYRGVAVDMEFVHGALDIGAQVNAQLKNEAAILTGLDNPNSNNQLTRWLETNLGEQLPNLRKETVTDLLKRDDLSPQVRRALELRQELNKTSTKKYDAIETTVCPDGRVRGLLQIYGANRTGRWAGRLGQVQNLPRTYTTPIEPAREFVRTRNANALRLIYGSVPDTLSQLIRTAFVSPAGHVLVDADFSAIEARVISWFAGEQWRLDVFNTHGKIYEASAAQMFNVPIERIKKGNPEYALRQKGKVAELALGYQGSVPAMIRFGALDMGIPEEELPGIVAQWREANPRIVGLWHRVEDAALQVVNRGGTCAVQVQTRDVERARANEIAMRKPYGSFSEYFNIGVPVIFAREYDRKQEATLLTVTLPSGRKLFYINPNIGENRFGQPSITYMGVNQKTGKWERAETYGGKLVENCVQAIARDCLSQAIEHLEAAGFPIVFHVHDEVIIDTEPFGTPEEMLKQVTDIMTKPIPWAPGLPLGADGWVGTFFTKD